MTLDRPAKRPVAIAAVLLTLAVLTIGRPPAAQAKTGPNARWTQQDNGDWPAHSSSPNCGPCVKWNNDLYWVTYFNGLTQPTFLKAADAAVSQWSSQPYRSPAFVKDQSTGGRANLVVTVKDLSAFGKPCGMEFTSYDGALAIYRTYVYLNTRQPFYTDPAVGGCNVTTTLLHEVGHAFAEGHSSLATDLMYKAAKTTNQSVDADAKAMLAAVYGPLPRTGGCNGAIGAFVGAPAAKLGTIAGSLSGDPSPEEHAGISTCPRTSAIPAVAPWRAPRRTATPIPTSNLITRRLETILKQAG